MTKPFLAYQVDDDLESSVIVYAKSAIAARRLGAEDLGIEFSQATCRRAGQWDHLYPKGPTQDDLWKDGWWFSCQECHGRANLECGGFHDGGGFFCESCVNGFYEMREVRSPNLTIDFYGPRPWPDDTGWSAYVKNGKWVEVSHAWKPHNDAYPLKAPGEHTPYIWYRP